MAIIEGSMRIRARSSFDLGPLPYQAAIVATPGVGKTEHALRVAAEFSGRLTEKRIHIFTADNEMTRETTERARDLFPAQVNVRFHRGRTDTRLGDALCHPTMHERAELVESLGGSVSELVCPTCPFAETCGWRAQNRDDGPGIVVMPNNYATLPAGGRCDLAIIDEEFVLGLARFVDVDFARLLKHDGPPDLPEWERGWAQGSAKRSSDEVFLFNVRLRLAVASGEGKRVPTLSALRAIGLTAGDAKRAKGIEYGRHDGVRSLLAKEIEKGSTIEEIRQAVADANARYGDAGEFAKVWSSLEMQLAIPEGTRDNLNGWWLRSERRLTVGYRKSLRVKDKPVLALDATGDRRLLQLALPHLTRVDVAAADAPHAHVIQVIDRKNSKSALVDAAHDTEKAKVEKASRRSRVVEIAEALGQGQPSGLISYHAVEGSQQVADAPSVILPGHFGLLRGQNGWGAVHALVVAGRWLPKAEAVEKIAGALFFDQPEAVLPGGAIEDGAGYYRLRNGDTMEGRAEFHSSPMAEAVRRQITEAELEQAVGRARGVRRGDGNPVVIAVLTTTPMSGVLVDDLVEYDDLVPDALELNFARSGVLLENARHAFKAFPELWGTEEAARKAYQRRRLGTSSLYKLYKGNVPNLAVKYQRAGAGQKLATAIFDPTRITDPRTWLTDRLGPLARFEATEMANVDTPEESATLPVAEAASPRAFENMTSGIRLSTGANCNNPGNEAAA